MPSPAEFDPTDLAAQERAAARLAEEERLAVERARNELRWVMSTKQGRRFIYRQLSGAGIWKSSFDTDALRMAFAEGSRNGGLQLLSEIMETCPDRYTEMLTEQKETEDAARNRTADRRNTHRNAPR